VSNETYFFSGKQSNSKTLWEELFSSTKKPFHPEEGAHHISPSPFEYTKLQFSRFEEIADNLNESP
jgi:hypothetical protein